MLAGMGIVIVNSCTSKSAIIALSRMGLKEADENTCRKGLKSLVGRRGVYVSVSIQTELKISQAIFTVLGETT